MVPSSNPNPILTGKGLDDDITTRANMQADGFIRLWVNIVYLSTLALPFTWKAPLVKIALRCKTE